MLNDETTKILGLYWNVRNDMLQYKIKKYKENAATNKKNFGKNGRDF